MFHSLGHFGHRLYAAACAVPSCTNGAPVPLHNPGGPSGAALPIKLSIVRRETSTSCRPMDLGVMLSSLALRNTHNSALFKALALLKGL